MRSTIDFSPLYHSAIGFDRMASLLDSVARDTKPSYPPYNIERTGEDAYRISMAVAGFGENDLTIEVKEHTLSVRGERADQKDDDGKEVLYRGIAERSFERRFQLADHVEVRGADLKNGLLFIDLVREIPEAMKPRSIKIGTAADKKAKVKTIEHAA